MRSSKDGAHGRQEPRIALEPDYAYSDGEDAAELASAYGYDLYPWQRKVLTSWLGRGTDDRFTAESCGLSVPRQNGKNALLEVRELYGIVTTGEKFLHTAHEVKTARKAFLRLASFFENERQYPELAAMVKCIRKTNGQEAVELWALNPKTGDVMVGRDGGSVEFSARSRGAARGYTVDTVIFDEAQELTDEQVEALVPTLAAAPSGNRQFIYTGTPPGPKSPGEVFARTRTNALNGVDATIAWHEWSVEALPRRDAPMDELVRLAYETNPTLGYRIDASFVEKEAVTMAIDGFARERLGWWSPTSSISRPISAKTWRETAIEAIGDLYAGKTAFGVKFSPDGASYALSGCKLGKGAKRSKAAVELIRTGGTASGTAELADWLIERKGSAAAVVIDGMAGAEALCARLAELKAPKSYVIRPRTADVVGAATDFADSLKSGDIAHTGDAELERSATLCVKRPIGSRGGWGFGSTDSAQSEPVESCALAYWGAKSTKRNPKRKQRML